MKLGLCAAVLFLWVVLSLGERCVEDGPYCKLCTSVSNFCGNEPGKCHRHTGKLPEDSPCAGLVKNSDKVCTIDSTMKVDFSTLTNQAYADFVAAAEKEYSECLNGATPSADFNEECCEKKCTTKECFCPTPCSKDQDHMETIVQRFPRKGVKACPSSCTSCKYGHTEEYCSKFCDEPSFFFACDDAACCDLESALPSIGKVEGKSGKKYGVWRMTGHKFEDVSFSSFETFHGSNQETTEDKLILHPTGKAVAQHRTTLIFDMQDKLDNMVWYGSSEHLTLTVKVDPFAGPNVMWDVLVWNTVSKGFIKVGHINHKRNLSVTTLTLPPGSITQGNVKVQISKDLKKSGARHTLWVDSITVSGTVIGKQFSPTDANVLHNRPTGRRSPYDNSL
eukprot:TRINITY_DN2018_c0_g1_i1.p1 TRINITY_DN2018_c0_g1~~TRINITY_DN2018_c0_g1_i1.p1  ORF type:complete len:392 (-),score=49.37 TRINITY_DN2018_c0_g1_i1:84-1259(-)